MWQIPAFMPTGEYELRYYIKTTIAQRIEFDIEEYEPTHTMEITSDVPCKSSVTSENPRRITITVEWSGLEVTEGYEPWIGVYKTKQEVYNEPLLK